MVKSERENPLKRGGRPGLDQDTLAALGSVANLLLELKQYDQAAPLLQECIDGLAMLVGPTHQSTLAATSNLAICFVKTTDFAAALPLAKQSLKGFTQVQGKQHPNTVKAAALMDEVTARLDSCASEQPEPAPEPAPGCAKCGTSAAKLKVCSRCKGVSYSSRECQKADWKEHKKLCNPPA